MFYVFTLVLLLVFLLKILSLVLMLSHFCLVAGLWKSTAETTQNFSFSGLQGGKELCAPSCPTSVFPSASKPESIEFNGNNGPSAINGAMYWPFRTEPQTDSLMADINKEQSEKKQETSTGCWLFGIQLVESSAVGELSPLTTNSCVGEEQAVTSLDVESDQQSQPSNINRSDAPAVSSEPEKSCLRSTQECQSRQLRSCTKVIRTCFFSLICCSYDRYNFTSIKPWNSTLDIDASSR